MPESVINGLKPEKVWEYFEELAKIPRPSKQETKVLQWITGIADENGLKWQQDKVGNLVVRRPGSAGGENSRIVIIQGHVDMVTEKNNEIQHDFSKDAIRLKREGDWLKADGTTLGADNGIGVAAALALMTASQDVKLPPLECLFTVDEETGLTGASGLDASLLQGKTMLNLDTEDWNEIFIGCAGGGDSVISVPIKEDVPPSSFITLELAVVGLLGGHSGLNIGEDRGNSVKITAQVVDSILEALPEARLASINAGDKRNALPREGVARILVPSAAEAEVKGIVSKWEEELKPQFQLKEKGFSLALSQGKAADSVLTQQSAKSLLDLLLILPHGVVKYSQAVEGLVETSNNLASVSPAGPEEYKIVMSSRSSMTPALEAQRRVIAKAAHLAGATVRQKDSYPGWQPNPTSKVVQLTKEVMAGITGSTPHVGAIHAGLECGLLGDKIPGLDMVSYGPTIRGAHSPDEKVQISTVEPFWKTTLQLLGRLADVKA